MKNEFYNRLKTIAGECNVLENEPMSLHTSFKIGGEAKYFVTPESIEALCRLIECCKSNDAEYIVLGNGSNVLVSDEGFKGVIIQLQKKLCCITTDGEYIYADAGALLSKISAEALKNSLAGFEFAAGIPGTLGGAVMMNAGAYGGEIKDVLVSADVYIPTEGITTVSNSDLKLGYRSSIIKNTDWIVLGAKLKLEKGIKEDIKSKIEALRIERTSKQPLDLPSAGSAFKRPEGNFAGKLIMDAGLRGYSVGDAAVSEKHCGFLVNKKNAAASDMKKLFDEIVDIVNEKYNVILEPEVRFIGEFAGKVY